MHISVDISAKWQPWLIIKSWNSSDTANELLVFTVILHAIWQVKFKFCIFQNMYSVLIEWEWPAGQATGDPKIHPPPDFLQLGCSFMTSVH